MSIATVTNDATPTTARIHGASSTNGVQHSIRCLLERLHEGRERLHSLRPSSTCNSLEPFGGAGLADPAINTFHPRMTELQGLFEAANQYP